MIRWTFLPEEERVLYAPIGLRLIDDFTGKPPTGPVDAALDLQDGLEWRATEVRPVVTASTIVTYPGLGREADVSHPPQHYRVRLETRFYRPLYRVTSDGVEFDAPPYNDTNPPTPITSQPSVVALLPASNYPFAPYIPVVRGIVEDTNGDPVPDVLVEEGLNERVLTDDRGSFSLPLRWVQEGVATNITAQDQRNGRNGVIAVTLPAALEQNQIITVS